MSSPFKSPSPSDKIVGSAMWFALGYLVLDRRREPGPKLAKGFLLGATVGAADAYLDTLYPRTK